MQQCVPIQDPLHMKKNYMKHILGSIFLLSAFSAVSQVDRCGTTEASKEMYQQHPELLKQHDEYNAMLNQKIADKERQRTAGDDVYVIPVVFHVLHVNGSENISDAQIQNQINILNRDFSMANKAEIDSSLKHTPNTPFDTLAANSRIEFRLAQIDPKGNCTNGIDRIYTHLTNAAGNQSKLNQWPREKYLNIWTVKTIGSSGVAGFAFMPADVATVLAPYDGIMILSNYIGSIGTGTPYVSRALTHEVGHYLSLYHPWGGTNNPEVDCSGDDQVADTPPTRGHTSCDLLTPFCTIYNLLNASYKFSNVTTGSGTTDPTPVPVNTGTTFESPKAVGVSPNSSENASFSFSKWDNGGDTINHDTTYSALKGSINTGKYYEITLTPKYKNSLTLTSMTFSFKRDSAGVRTYSVRSSLDNFANNLTASVNPANKALRVQPGNIFFSFYDTTAIQNGSTINLSAFKNLTKPVTFRIYGWNAEDSTGTFGIDSLTFAGSAGIIENTQNFMDYSYCSVMFTKGQKVRMRTALESSVSGRSNLWSTNNLIATGVNGNGKVCEPVADFYADASENIVCSGEDVVFKSNVLYSLPGKPLTYQWEFSGGTPATSTQANPTVKYTKQGYYDVKLTVTNEAGSKTVTKQSYIYVWEKDGEDYLSDGFQENFEEQNRFDYWWHIRNLDEKSNRWERMTGVGYNSQNCVRMHAEGNYSGDVDQLFSPSMNLAFMKDLKLSFRYIAATKATLAGDMTDNLKVSYSYNCGLVWSTAIDMKGISLFNAGFHPEDFVPAANANWAFQEVNIPIKANSPNIIFRFEYKTGAKSNNIYLDDINLTGVVGVDENTTQESNIAIFPNPAKESATIAYHLAKSNAVVIELTDILGKQVAKFNMGTQQEGDHTLNLSKEDLKLKNGIYFIRISIGKAAVTRKLILTE